jgi:hypothetical protein
MSVDAPSIGAIALLFKPDYVTVPELVPANQGLAALSLLPG